jgi:hypothetical protein
MVVQGNVSQVEVDAAARRTLTLPSHFSSADRRSAASARSGGLSRRKLLQATTGAAAGLALGGFLGRAGIAAGQEAVPPVPIPGGSPGIEQLAGGLFHVYGPGAEGLDPADAEPITITDFDGSIGLAYVSGMVQRTNMKTGEVRQLPFVDSDMRFMKGSYRGTDGQIHEGAFAFI